MWQSIELYLLFFYISVLDLPPAAAAAIFLAGAVIDWLADPLIGILIDRTAARLSLRAWTLIGGPLSGGAMIVTFAQPDLPPSWAFAYALAAHLVLRACYSLGNIPYGALTARISDDPADHVALTGARMQGAALGGLIAAAIYALLPARAGSDDANFLAGAVLLAILAQPAFLITYFGVRERVHPRAVRIGSAAAQLLEFVALIRSFPSVRRLMAAILAAGLGITVIHKSILFLFRDLDAIDVGYAVTLLPPLSLLLSVPLWVRLARRIGRARALLWSTLLNLAAAAALPFVTHSVAGVGFAVTLAVIAGSGMSVMFWALVPDVVGDVESRHHGEASAARVYVLAGIARKLAQALAPQLVALTLMAAPAQSVAYSVLVGALVAFGVIATYRPREHQADLPSVPL